MVFNFWIKVCRLIRRSLPIMTPMVCAAMVLMGCGGGGSGDAQGSPTGRVAFNVTWDRSTVADNPDSRADVTDCADVDTVAAAVYDAGGGLLQTGGPWNCTAGEGIIGDVPGNHTIRVAIVGNTIDGLARYRGESAQTIFLPSGGTVDAGTIVAGSFLPTLAAPANGARVAPVDLVLQWNAISGADHYRATIADDPDFNASTIVQTIASNNTECQPDTTGLAENTAYYWQVQAIDAAGNMSEPSAYRNFQISHDLLSVHIDTPATSTQVRLDTPVSFSATVTDADGTLLTTDALAAISWSSNLDNVIASQLAFTTSTLSLGTHTITLSVEDTAGLVGSAQVTIEVLTNLSPVATIAAPVNGSSYSVGFGQNLECQGSGIDPEEGTLTSADQLHWQMVNPAQPDEILWEGAGTTASIDYPAFGRTSGTYRITFTATDSEGGSGTTFVDVTIQALANLPPAATIVTPISGTSQSISLGQSLNCQGTGIDPEEGTLTSATQMVWQMVYLADPGEILWEGAGTSASIDFASFGATGTYRITLTVTDSEGASDAAFADLSMQVIANSPPVATIVAPAFGESYQLGFFSIINCQGTGIDPEDGTLTSATQMLWQMVDLADPGTIIWTGSGTSTIIDYLVFETNGTYRITLTAIDSEGVSDTYSVDITIT